MDEKQREQVALFRYGLISGLVNRKLQRGEMAEGLRTISRQEHIDPNGRTVRVSDRTLERYIRAYRTGGYEALKPVRRGGYAPRSLSEDVLAKAIALKEERPERSVSQIIRILELADVIQSGDIAESTLSKQFRKRGITRKQITARNRRRFRRFEFPYRNACWQSDVQHTLYLPDPELPGRRKTAKLFAVMDDYSRKVISGLFYYDERGAQLEDCLMKAMLSSGKPEQIYVDNGAIYRSDMLKKACARLGIKLSFSKAGRPQGRGKIERFFQFVDSSFKPEAYDLIESEQITSIEQLNRYFYMWLQTFYHERVHGETKQTPNQRYDESDGPVVHLSVEEIRQAFLWETDRKVDKTGCVSFQTNRYEVDQELVGKTITLRYDPVDLERMEVWHDGTQYGDAIGLDLHRRVDERWKEGHSDGEPAHPSSGLNFLDLQVPHFDKQQQAKRGQLSYASAMRGESND